MTSLTLSDLAQFTGSERFYRHTLYRRGIYTEGVQFLAERAGAYWLIDLIMLAQPVTRSLRHAEFQCWTLTRHADEAATLVATDGNGNRLYRRAISWTDFPLSSVELWFANNTLYLPSEH